MKKAPPFLLLFFNLSLAALSQKADGLVKGNLVDTASKISVTDATVSVVNARDSALVAYSLSDKKGAFEINNLPAGSYRIYISHQSYQTFKKNFSITAEKKTADLGEIILEKEYKALAEVIVTDDAPIKIKQDTVEFKADAFKTKPNATVEDLLKKVPGMQVDKDGTVKAQGETVQKVYVDGKEFFGNDPKLATKNLTADMVESVQVFDDMSEQAKFSKIDDGSRQKAINLKLKKDKKKGFFGRALAGIGTNDRYETNISFNRFNGDMQMSVLANANNLNKQGFSFSDIITAMGGFQNMANMSGGSGGFGGSNTGGPFGGSGGMQVFSTRAGGFGSFFGGTSSGGITRSISAGINYNNYFSPKIKFGANYFFSNSKNTQQRDVFRKTTWSKDSVSEQSDQVRSNSINQNYRINLRLEYMIDSANSLLYTPSFTLQHSENFSFDTIFSYSTEPAKKWLAIQGKTENRNDRDGLNLNNNLLFRHRFKKTGRTITIGWSNNYSESDADAFSISSNRFYNSNGQQQASFAQDRNIIQKTFTRNNTLSASYTEPVGKDKLLEFNYAYTHNSNTSDKKTFDFDSGSGKYSIINPILTNYFENLYTSNRFGANFRVQKKKYNYQLGAAIQLSTLTSESLQGTASTKATSKQNFKNFFPTANFNYQPTRAKSLRISYRGRTNQPSLSQLQNVIDQSNPLQWRTGNPSLKQEFNHNLNIGYNMFNILSFKFFAATLNFNITASKIVNSTEKIAQGITLIKPVNLDGSYNSLAFVTVGLPFKNKKLRGSSLNFTTSAMYNNDVSMFDKQINKTKTLTLTQGAGANFSLLKEKLDLGANFNISYYNVKSTLASLQDEDYFSQTYSADISYTFKHNFIVATDFDYYVNSGRASGFNQSVPLWNASVSKQFLKNKNAELKFSVNDILNQNQSINRTAAENYIEDTRSVVLRQYFMISFLYNLNKMGGKQMPTQMPKMMEKGIRNIRIQ